MWIGASGRLGERQRPMGGHGLCRGGPGDGMVARSRVSPGEGRGNAGIDQDRVLAVDREHAAGPAHRAHGVEQPPVVKPEVVAP